MEGDAVAVDAVEDAQARLGGPVDAELGVVRLRLLEMASLGPRLSAPACQGGSTNRMSHRSHKWVI